jgi:GTP-dependent phosphoenolpyruvate carboxykinase
MKKLSLNNITDVFIESINKTHLELLDTIKVIKQEYTQNIIEEKIKLLMIICEGENLDFNMIKSKYLKPKELSQIKEKTSSNVELCDDTIMDKIEVNGKQYYCEAKDKSTVYDMNAKAVGHYKNGSIIFD